MKSSQAKYIPWILCLGIVVFYSLVKFYLPDKIKKSGSTSYNSRNVGLSVFLSYLETNNKEKVELFEKAFLNKGDIEKYKTIFVSNPLIPPSKKEIGVLQEFVRRGGDLIIHLQGLRASTFIDPLLESFNLTPTKISENPSFQNQQVEEVQFSKDLWLFKPDEKYAAYSDIEFSSEHCSRSSRGHCFFEERFAGNGRIIIALGVSPFSNALINRLDNKRVLFRMETHSLPLAIDEYHHLFSNLGVSDLLTHPRFAIPIFAFLSLIIVYFLFSRPEQDTTVIKNKILKSKSYHSLNQSVLNNQLKKPIRIKEAYALQVTALKRQFPFAIKELDDLLKNSNFPQKIMGQKIISLHKKYLSQRKGDTQ